MEERVREIRKRIEEELCGKGYMIIQSDGKPWNAWCINENGFSTFKTGAWWEFLKRLKAALEKEGLTGSEEYAWVVSQLEEIEDEWRLEEMEDR